MVSKLCDRYFFSHLFFGGLWPAFLIVVPEAGAGGGLVASIATCPLDVIKTKLQAQRAVQGQQGYLSGLGVSLHVPSCIYFIYLDIQFHSFMLRYRQVYFH